MRYAEICVNSPIASRRTFSYSIPENLPVEAGFAVWAPFGNRLLQGIVLEITDIPAVEETREIAEVITDRPILSGHQIKLVRWISEYDLSPLFDAVALMLPPGFERRAVTYVTATGKSPETELIEPQKQVLDMLTRTSRLMTAEIKRIIGQKKSRETVSSTGSGLSTSATRSSQNAPSRNSMILSVSQCRKSRQPKHLQPCGNGRQNRRKPVPVCSIPERRCIAHGSQKRNAGRETGSQYAGPQQGPVHIYNKEVSRSPLSGASVQESMNLPLVPEQETALDAITASLKKSDGQVFLLHGVTGSGKTEVYLRSLAEAVKQGRRGLVLVPEISMTPQMI